MTHQEKFNDWRLEINLILTGIKCPDELMRELGYAWDEKDVSWHNELKECSPEMYDRIVEWLNEGPEITGEWL